VLIQGSARTDTGKLRPKNEDAFGYFPELALYVVGDGMGGHAGGESASALTVETMRLSLQETQAEDFTPVTDPEGRCFGVERRLLIAVQQANSRVLEMSRQDPSLAGMGTTVAAVLLEEREGLASVCHVGDSRVYRIRAGRIEQLTEDHSLAQQLFRDGKISAQEAKTSPHRHVLTQALGVSPVVQPTVRVEELRKGDVFIICSDGVHGVVEEEEILNVLVREGSALQKACDALIDLANARGGRDNSTVIILRYDNAGEKADQP
jgi:serine/threonine protein phosphatase PrpC